MSLTLRLCGTGASILCAFDMGEKALGYVDQSLLSHDALWLYWFGAFGWAVVAAQFAFGACYKQVNK
jgi:hypothetical protein